jgi:hypothetical protein
MHRPLLIIVLQILLGTVYAQSLLYQNIKGTVTDRILQTPLAGATVSILGNESHTTVCGADGSFHFEKVLVGRHTVQVSFIGYRTITLTNLALESGKELVLAVEMDEEIKIHNEVTVTSRPDKSKPLNNLAMVSSRMFSVEETRRFAAGINDPSRIATAFAGVTGHGDGNALVIRGNAPNGLLWRMEGVDIPNPNHFASVGTSGGGISILSAQLLANSDFMTSAFPAEYGNALSGVFDIRLRKGNREKREYTVSASTIGIDAAAEGYFSKNYGGSYLINYRYGFLTLMQKLGLNIGDAATSFQDLSFNINLPTKKLGTFSVFGFGGLSSQTTDASNDSLKWIKDPSVKNGKLNKGNTGAIGITHSIRIGKKTLLKTIYSINGYLYQQNQNRYEKINGPLITTQDNTFTENTGVFSVTATHKFNARHLLIAGVYSSSKRFDLKQRELSGSNLYDKVKSAGTTTLTQFFTEWKCDPTDRLGFQTGLHGQYFALNKTAVYEPRFGARYRLNKTQTVSMGVGLHSQIQPLGNYFARIKTGTDTTQPNRELGFSRSLQYVLGYNWRLSPDWNLKAETYYQWLFQIPVSALKQDSYSLLNQDDDYAITTLANKGAGKNYGIELTLERYWNDRFYLLSSLSIFKSAYLPSDKKWRDARFNTGKSFTFLTGKEWNLKRHKQSTIATDIKLMYNGGVRVTPIDLAKSITQKTTVLDNTRAYEQKLGDFFRIDLQAEWRFQRNGSTGSLIAGVQNLLNRKNPVSQFYDAATQKIRYNYLLGLIPVVGYKLEW